MVFIRKKKINGQDYAYLVKNKWTQKGSRQKAKYLGKVVHLDIVKDVEFDSYCMEKHGCSMNEFVKEKSKAEIVNELIVYELIRRGFEVGEVTIKKKNLIGKIEKSVEVTLNNGLYYYKSRALSKIRTLKEVILEMNEGFLCRWAVDKLLRAKITGYDEREQGIKLAKVLLEAGLKVENDVFVLLFSKFTNNNV